MVNLARGRVAARLRFVAGAAVVCLALSSCAGSVVDGQPAVGNAPDARLSVKGDSGQHFDVVAKNALSDAFGFWKTAFPKVSGGKAFEPLAGGLYSVDGLKVVQTKQLPATVADNECARRDTSFVVDNGAFCRLDDSIAWDRAQSHLFAQLANKYGDLVVALIFAHEVGHAISYRLGVFDKDLPTIDTESQADCAAGAWAASALKGQAPHFRDTTPQKIDEALEGFLNGRDDTPETSDDVSHGNGFDRLSAVADGIDKGPTYCFSDGYFASRKFTERPFTSDADRQTGGNTPLAQVLAAGDSNTFVQDLNRFWTASAKSIGKTLTPVRFAEADHPKCGATPTAEIGYCPDDNTVYYNTSFARHAYYSLPAVDVDRSTADVKIVDDQPADFALGVLLAIGWGLAVRHQLFDRSLDDTAALRSAICYTGAYAKDINLAADDPRVTSGDVKVFLSPADLDEATSSMISIVGQDTAFGARGTTGLDRIQDFVRGYNGGLHVC